MKEYSEECKDEVETLPFEIGENPISAAYVAG
jgi:hypothetical protein